VTSEFPELPDDIWARILGIYSHCPRAVYMVSKIARVSKFFFEYARPLKISTCPQLPARVWLHVLNMFNDSNGLYAPKELDKISRVSTLFFYYARTHPDNIPALSILERAALSKYKASTAYRKAVSVLASSRSETSRIERLGEHNAIGLILLHLRKKKWWQWPADRVREALGDAFFEEPRIVPVHLARALHGGLDPIVAPLPA